MVSKFAKVAVHLWVHLHSWLGALSEDNGHKATLFAGTGSSQQAENFKEVGDGGLPTDAFLSRPSSVAVDPESGDVYIADTGHHRIRRVGIETGKIQTYAGSCFDAKDEESGEDIVRCDGFAGDGDDASKAMLNTPFGMMIHEGILYFVDSYNHRIRTIDLATGIINTLAGGGSDDGVDSVDVNSIKFHFPTDIALDGEKQVLYVADWMNNLIRGIDLRARTVSTYVGEKQGSKYERKLRGPINMDFDHKKRHLYFGERDGNRLWIWKVDDDGPDADGPVPLTGQRIAVSMDEPVLKGYTGDNQPASMARMSKPAGIAVGPDGNVYFADQFNHCLRVVQMNRDEPMMTTWVGDLNGKILRNPFGLHFHPQTGDLFITERGENSFWVRSWALGLGPSDPVPPPQTGQSPRQPEKGTCGTPEECAAQAADEEAQQAEL